jgi:hypothetical protein
MARDVSLSLRRRHRSLLSAPLAARGARNIAVTYNRSEETGARDDASVNRRERRNVEKQKAPASVNDSAPAEQSAPLRPLPTVTVMIDPTTGLLAKASCPVKSSMTYPAGQEPHQYCGADHRQTSAATDAPTDSKSKSRLKSLANRIAAPARWLKEKSQQDNSTSP